MPLFCSWDTCFKNLTLINMKHYLLRIPWMYTEKSLPPMLRGRIFLRKFFFLIQIKISSLLFKFFFVIQRLFIQIWLWSTWRTKLWAFFRLSPRKYLPPIGQARSLKIFFFQIFYPNRVFKRLLFRYFCFSNFFLIFLRNSPMACFGCSRKIKKITSYYF